MEQANQKVGLSAHSLGGMRVVRAKRASVAVTEAKAAAAEARAEREE